MYNFEVFNLENINKEEYENYSQKNLFATVRWLEFLKEWKKVEPLILKITKDGNLVGHFTAAETRLLNLKVIGSPFYGWMGQHLGFDLEDDFSLEKASTLIDETILFLKDNFDVDVIYIADFKFNDEIIEKCNMPTILDMVRKTYMLDITPEQEILFKNLRSGYRTCVRKFDKMGGHIEEDYSPEFIEEHHKQLEDVFGRKGLSAPNYRERMDILYNKYKDMVLSIKALDENGNNIASSYYLYGGKLAFFASNASNANGLKYNANQALMWYAMNFFKEKGIDIIDLAGGADYKKNFGSELYETRAMIWCKNKSQYKLITFLKDAYYKTFRIKGKFLKIVKKDNK